MTSSLNANTPLARTLADNPGHSSFPDHNVNYFDRFTRIDDHLNKNVHPYVNVGPTAREPIWLTDHGPDHISTVIRRAGELASSPELKAITPYEAYILLLACHLHDVGNIFGREEHEKKVLPPTAWVRENCREERGRRAGQGALPADSRSGVAVACGGGECGRR